MSPASLEPGLKRAFFILAAAFVPAVAAAALAYPFPPPGPPPAARTVVYYFHRTYRCQTCLKAEDYARQTLDDSFAEDQKAGRIVFRAVNLDEPANRHFAQEHQLTSSSMALSFEDGEREIRFLPLPGTRVLIRDRAAFIRFLFGEIERFREEPAP